MNAHSRSQHPTVKSNQPPAYIDAPLLSKRQQVEVASNDDGSVKSRASSPVDPLWMITAAGAMLFIFLAIAAAFD